VTLDDRDKQPHREKGKEMQSYPAAVISGARTKGVGLNDIQVESYAGYRGDQEPRVLILEGRRLIVQEILGRWRGPTGRYFRIRTSDGREYELLHEESTGLWSESGRV
jgi:hypothetical protein